MQTTQIELFVIRSDSLSSGLWPSASEFNRICWPNASIGARGLVHRILTAGGEFRPALRMSRLYYKNKSLINSYKLLKSDWRNIDDPSQKIVGWSDRTSKTAFCYHHEISLMKNSVFFKIVDTNWSIFKLHLFHQYIPAYQDSKWLFRRAYNFLPHLTSVWGFLPSQPPIHAYVSPECQHLIQHGVQPERRS